MLTIKKLKEIIANLPDDWIVCTEDEDHFQGYRHKRVDLLNCWAVRGAVEEWDGTYVSDGTDEFGEGSNAISLISTTDILEKDIPRSVIKYCGFLDFEGKKITFHKAKKSIHQTVDDIKASRL